MSNHFFFQTSFILSRPFARLQQFRSVSAARHSSLRRVSASGLCRWVLSNNKFTVCANLFQDQTVRYIAQSPPWETLRGQETRTNNQQLPTFICHLINSPKNGSRVVPAKSKRVAHGNVDVFFHFLTKHYVQSLG